MSNLVTPAGPSSTVTVAPQGSIVAEAVTLRLVPRRKKKSVKWSEEVLDNEFAGKKKSKKCCIFHRRREFGDWSDEDDSDAENCECPEPGQHPNQQQQQQPKPSSGQMPA